MPSKNPNGRRLAEALPGLTQASLERAATQAMQYEGCTTADVAQMQQEVRRARSVMGAVRAIARWVDLGMPESD